MLRVSVGLAALAAIAFAVSPAASKSMDCSAKNTTAAVGGIAKMGDGPAREKVQGHMVSVNSSLAKGDMKGCAKHMTSAMKGMKS
jgi:hypothetical protein